MSGETKTERDVDKGGIVDFVALVPAMSSRLMMKVIDCQWSQ